MKLHLLLTGAIVSIGMIGNAQTPELNAPVSIPTHQAPQFSAAYRAPGDSCGAYFNNYVGLGKTSLVFFESLRTGNGSEMNEYAGRAQRFHAPQPIEVSGIEFFAFETNPLLDSLMVITQLFDYDAGADDVGAELARDTVYVKHSAFSPLLTDLSVKSFFDPVVVSSDYIIAITTPTDDSLKIITSDPSGDGGAEGVSYALYENPIAFPGFYQWYSTLTTFGPSYDLDYLISPMVKFQLQDGFTLVNDSICPGITGAACVEYDQLPIFDEIQYNSNAATPNTTIQWLWDDGFQNGDIYTACHTYAISGIYDLSLKDTLKRYVFSSVDCPFERIQNVYVLDSVTPEFTFLSAGLTADFVNTTTGADSVSWDFGDGTLAGNEDTPSHTYASIGMYDVWLYAYGPCNNDSVMYTITISDVGLDNKELTVGMHPNPADNNLTIQGNFNHATIQVYNILGQPVYTKNNVSGKQFIDCSQWQKGTYLVRVADDSGEKTLKLIVK